MKKLILGLIVGMVIGSASVSIAANDYIQAQFAEFNFVVNGEVVELEAEPLLYQGTTYLPVRVLSNTLGYDVTYKGDSRTIELDKSTETYFNELDQVMSKGAIEEVERAEQIEPEISIEHIDSQIEYFQGRIKTMERLIKSYPESGFTKEEYEADLQHWQNLKLEKEAIN